MGTGQIIILLAYVFGQLIIGYFLKQTIDTLKNQVKSQSEILSNVEKFVNIFKVEEVEKYVELVKKKSDLEKEEILKEVERKYQSEMDKAKIEKDKINKAFAFLRNEISALIGFSVDLITFFTFHPYIDISINNMKESVTKQEIQGVYKKIKEDYIADGKEWMKDLTIKTAVLTQSGYFEKNKK